METSEQKQKQVETKEEVLTVSRKRVQELYTYITSNSSENYLLKEHPELILHALFDYKSLPN